MYDSGHGQVAPTCLLNTALSTPPHYLKARRGTRSVPQRIMLWSVAGLQSPPMRTSIYRVSSRHCCHMT